MNVVEIHILDQAINTLTTVVDQRLCLVMVESAWGSSPRPRGSMLWVNSHGHFGGSVSAGCLEVQVIADALKHLQSSCRYDQKSYQINNTLAWENGLSCGGQITLLFIQLDITDLGWMQEWSKQVHDNQSCQLVITSPERPWVVPQLPMPPVSNRPIGPEACADSIVFYHKPLVSIICIGAVPITQSLSHYATVLHFPLVVIEPRESWQQAYSVSSDISVESVWPDESRLLHSLKAHHAVVALTHDPKIDDQALGLALESNCFYIGALGSTRSHESRLNRLAQQGFEQEALNRVHGPVGLDIGATTSPAQIALATISQIVAIWNQTQGL